MAAALTEGATTRRRGARGPYRGKRLLDLMLVVLSAPLWVPALLVVALLVRRRLGRPVLFRQQRPGRGGEPFELLKFRSMTDERDAAGILLSDEARLPSFGRWLRGTSLDELPELLNILRGEMSFVGPRPLLMAYLPLYSARHSRRHEVLPGLTGLAQVAGRNVLSWHDRFELDVEYVERASLALDVHILLRTVSTVLRREGVSAPGEATMQAFTGYEPPPSSRPETPPSRIPGPRR
ncbi:MAG: undecaprenyl-phosphate galactose phosphotransferase [Gemmatimonadetes bacterium]|jgi:sugar transferase EpsL|nr:undecaprenyl-phosphate galactose phosphotransferase [Gemmatimonadota bacterium]